MATTRHRPRCAKSDFQAQHLLQVLTDGIRGPSPAVPRYATCACQTSDLGAGPSDAATASWSVADSTASTSSGADGGCSRVLIK